MAKPNGHSSATHDRLILQADQRAEMAAMMAARQNEIAMENRMKIAAIAGTLASRFDLDAWKDPTFIDFCAVTALNIVGSVDRLCDERGRKAQDVAKAMAEKPLLSES